MRKFKIGESVLIRTDLAVGLILISAFISVFGFFLTFSRNIAIIQYPMGYLLLEILK